MNKTITKLEAQKKNPNRVNVHLDGEYAFSLQRIVAAWLSNGQVLTEEKIADLNRQDATEYAYQSALGLLNSRSRSKTEMRTRLQRKGFSEEQIDTVIQRLSDARLLDDSAFAKSWIENRTTFRPRSHRAIAFELRQKGVTGQTIETALRSAEDDSTLAYRVAGKYASRLAGLDQKTFLTKLGGHLGRKGFGYDVITPVCRQLWQEVGAAQISNMENEESNDE